MPGIALVQMRKREGRTRAIPQQPLLPHSVGTLDAHRAIHREAAVVRPGAHLRGVILVDQATIDEGAQDPGSQARLHVGKRRRVERTGKGGMKADARRLVRGDRRFEYPVDDAAVEVDVLVQRSSGSGRARSGLSRCGG